VSDWQAAPVIDDIVTAALINVFTTETIVTREISDFDLKAIRYFAKFITKTKMWRDAGN
jgi:hypothetical protein